MSTPTCTAPVVVVALLGQRRGERPAGDLDDLEGAYDAAAVARQHLRRRRRVDARPAARALRAGPDLGELLLEPLAYVGIGARELELVEDRAGVERRTAHQHGETPLPRQSSITSRAQPWNSATVAGSVTSSTSSRWWVIPRRSSGGSFAVPMSMPR